MIRSPASASAATAFDQTSYTIRPRVTLIESLVGRRYSEYEIQSVPPASNTYFSFSWTTGILRQEPNGSELLVFRPAKRPHRFFRRAYVATDPRSGEMLGRVVPMGTDWEIIGGADQSLAYVLEIESGYAAATFILRVGEQEVCRYTWRIHGATVLSAALDLEFLPAAEPLFDRTIAVALSPILEQKARLTSEWYA